MSASDSGEGARRANEELEIIHCLLEGETANFYGKYYQVKTQDLAPLFSKPHLPSGWAVSRRSARDAPPNWRWVPGVKVQRKTCSTAMSMHSRLGNQRRTCARRVVFLADPGRRPREELAWSGTHVICQLNLFGMVTSQLPSFHIRDEEHSPDRILNVVDVDRIAMIRGFASAVPLTHHIPLRSTRDACQLIHIISSCSLRKYSSLLLYLARQC
jgi:hypothetical protein